MKQKMNYGIRTGAVMGASLTAMLLVIVGLLIVANFSSLSNSGPSTVAISTIILGVIFSGIVGIIFSGAIGAVGAIVLIHLITDTLAKKFGVEKGSLIERWETRHFAILGAIGGGISNFILIICPFLYTLV